jgi:hypothetical protein
MAHLVPMVVAHWKPQVEGKSKQYQLHVISLVASKLPNMSYSVVKAREFLNLEGPFCCPHSGFLVWVDLEMVGAAFVNHEARMGVQMFHSYMPQGIRRAEGKKCSAAEPGFQVTIQGLLPMPWKTRSTTRRNYCSATTSFGSECNALIFGPGCQVGQLIRYRQIVLCY